MNTLSELIKNRMKKEFKPKASYFACGDFISCYFEDDLAYAEDIDETLTIYRCTKTDKIVGCKIKGVKELINGIQR